MTPKVLPPVAPRWRWPRSRPRPKAFHNRPLPDVRKSPSCLDLQGWDRCLRPFFRRMFGPVQTDLIPVDSPKSLVAFGQSAPRLLENAKAQPFLEAPQAGLVRRKPRGHHLPWNPRNQNVENSMQAFAVCTGGPTVAYPHDRRQQGLEFRPDLLWQAACNIFEFHEKSPSLCFLGRFSYRQFQWLSLGFFPVALSEIERKL